MSISNLHIRDTRRNVPRLEEQSVCEYCNHPFWRKKGSGKKFCCPEHAKAQHSLRMRNEFMNRAHNPKKMDYKVVRDDDPCGYPIGAYIDQEQVRFMESLATFDFGMELERDGKRYIVIVDVGSVKLKQKLVEKTI